MLLDIDASIRARFLVHLNQQMLFILHNPANAQKGHSSAVSLVELMSHTEIISAQQKMLLLTGIDSALLSAIKVLRERRGD